MKYKNILTFALLICIAAMVYSCTKKKNDLNIAAKQPNSTNKSAVLSQLDSIEVTAPIYYYTDEERNSPIDSCTIPIDINGLELGKSYSLEELIRIWGDFTQTDYWKQKGKEDWENDKIIHIIIKTGIHNSGFRYSRGWGFHGFTLYDPRFSIYNGFISVGKPVELFNALGCGRLVGSNGNYRFFTNNDPRVNLFYIDTDSKGIITCISFTTYDISGYYKEDGYAL